jgi:hypothetical protein
VGVEVSVGHGGVAPGHQLDHGHHLGGEGDLGKSYLTGQPAHGQFVLRPGIGMHEHHRQAADAPVQNGLQTGAQGVDIQGLHYHHAFAGDPFHDRLDRRRFIVPEHAYPLVHLDHRFVEQIRLFDLQVEDGRSILVADLQDIPESTGYQQGAAGAFAFQQGVGGHRGAHADPLDGFRRHAVFGKVGAGDLGQDPPDALPGGVVVILGIFGEQLDHPETGFTGDFGVDVGKGAAAVNGKSIFFEIGHGESLYFG